MAKTKTLCQDKMVKVESTPLLVRVSTNILGRQSVFWEFIFFFNLKQMKVYSSSGFRILKM